MNFITNDLLYVLYFWGVWFFLGISVFPLVIQLFHSFWDGGYAFAKGIGFLLLGYLMWVFQYVGFFSINRLNILFILGLIICASGWMFWKEKKKYLRVFLDKWKHFVLLELIFGISLLWWGFVRSNAPEIVGIEKFMDFGFINAVLRSDSLPVKDPWFAGESIPYYYFNHYLSAVMIGLSGVKASIGYNLMVASFYALSVVMSFGIGMELWIYFGRKKQLSCVPGSNVLLNFRQKCIDHNSRMELSCWGYLAGGLTVFFVVVAGNLDVGVYYLRKWFGSGVVGEYGFAGATRLIENTIHEFPSYAFLIGDLHAHMMNIVGVLLFIAVSLSLFISKKIRVVNFIVLGWLLGIFVMSNSWDMPIYFLLIGSLLVAKYRNDLKNNWKAIIYPLVLMSFVSIVVSWFFLNDWNRPWFGFEFVEKQSLFSAWFVHWGGMLGVVGSYIYILNKHLRLKKSDIFVLILTGLAGLLIVIPELIYVRYMPSDVGINDHRGNTMFKLSYQAWILLSVAAGFGLTRICLWMFSKKVKYLKIGVVGIIIFLLATGWYQVEGLKSYYNNLKTYQGIDGENRVLELYPDDMAAIEWLNSEVEGSPVIVEAVGERYSHFGRVSSYTGLPTIMGWPEHEFLWRASSEKNILIRIQDADTFYIAKDLNLLQSLVDKYNVEYVFYGQLEQQRFPEFDDQIIKSVGFESVFVNNDVVIYKYH